MRIRLRLRELCGIRGTACHVEADDLLDARVEDREEQCTGPCSLLWRRLDFVLGMIEQVTWGNSTT